jgi:hypothetical protein
MLAEQSTAAAAAARNTAGVDEIARLTWRTHAEGQLHDAEAEAISEALQTRRAALATGKGLPPSRAPVRIRPRALAPLKPVPMDSRLRQTAFSSSFLQKTPAQFERPASTLTVI